MSHVYYKSGKLLVSNNLFRTPRRSYRISDIEKVTIKRPLFWIGVPIAIGSFMMLTEFSAYLYEEEKYICIALFSLLPLILWNIGTLSVTSKSYANDDAITGFMPSLRNAREALENRIIAQSDKEVKHG